MGETREKTAIHQNGPSPHLKHHLQLKTKEAVEGRHLGLQGGGRKFTWKWSSKCLVNKHLLGLQRQWDPEWTLISKGFPHHTESILSTEVSGVPLLQE